MRYLIVLLASIAVGMATNAEVDFNVAFFEGRPVPEGLRRAVAGNMRTLVVEDWCTGCGRCIERCTAQALFLAEGKARVDLSLCRLCGYCGSACPEFALKIV